MTVSPFQIEISDADLDDLRSRLRRTRFTGRSGAEPWSTGTDPDYLRDLVAYWSERFDWRAREAELNSLAHFRATIDGKALHYVHVRAPGASTTRPPLILSHGWPSSFTEMLGLADRLANPARYDAAPDSACDVVIPSLPGFLFSELIEGPITRRRLAQTLHRLMTDVLGYEGYGAFGGDIGGAATAWLGARYPDHVVGIHMIHPPFPADFDDPPLSDSERAYLETEELYDETDGGYSAIMATRPDTIAAALADSPAGLAAWIIDKFRDWSDCDGDVESRFSRDELLTVATLYWVTDSIGTSFRQYVDYDHNEPRPPITVPAAFTVSHEPALVNLPRSIPERACTDIRHWSEPGRGGHFMPAEEPDLLAAELRQFFGSLDSG
jgi:pimeloyl-ACP methyl ester carboxylesterase